MGKIIKWYRAANTNYYKYIYHNDLVTVYHQGRCVSNNYD